MNKSKMLLASLLVVLAVWSAGIVIAAIIVTTPDVSVNWTSEPTGTVTLSSTTPFTSETITLTAHLSSGAAGWTVRFYEGSGTVTPVGSAQVTDGSGNASIQIAGHAAGTVTYHATITQP